MEPHTITRTVPMRDSVHAVTALLESASESTAVTVEVTSVTTTVGVDMARNCEYARMCFNQTCQASWPAVHDYQHDNGCHLTCIKD
jgi:hypothetical protein